MANKQVFEETHSRGASANWLLKPLLQIGGGATLISAALTAVSAYNQQPG